MTEEMIGNVKLDYRKYSGEDLYCDGEVEEELLEIAKNRPREEYADLIEEKKSWPILYHLSYQRENIVDWLPIGPEDKVLEVGSGCGAITGALAEKAGEVTCVELSKKRSLINAWRHRECGNVTIRVGNFQEIEPDLPEDFSYICLIGVFEYGISYIGGEHPFHDFLRLLRKHLSEGGRIVIAIENKYGMKYFAGCREDHLGSCFSGIENYGEGAVARTFSKTGLEKIFRDCGAGKFHFYYPYPDYKFMTALYSDRRLPEKGELYDNIRNFDGDRMLLFDERKAFDGTLEEGVFPLFSNSFLVVLGDSIPVEYVKYSNDRAPEYRIRTSICSRGVNGRFIRKEPLHPAAAEHVRSMAAACESLTRRYAGSGLKVNACRLTERNGTVCAEFEYVGGRSLAALLDDCLERGDEEGFRQLFQSYVQKIGHNSDMAVADFDMAFSNILVEKNRWTLIDYEWTFGQAIETRELAFRAFHCYLLEDERRSRIDEDRVLEELGISGTEAEKIREKERDFQKYVTGGRLAMGELRERMGTRVFTPDRWREQSRDGGPGDRIQIYEDRGRGYSEEDSYFVENARREDGKVRAELTVDGDVRRLRIDPAFCSCAVRILEISFNGESVPLKKRGILRCNGKAAKPEKGADGTCSLSVLFATEDPGISLELAGFERKPENKLYFSMEIVCLPSGMARSLAGTVKRGRH